MPFRRKEKHGGEEKGWKEEDEDGDSEIPPVGLRCPERVLMA